MLQQELVARTIGSHWSWGQGHSIKWGVPTGNPTNNSRTLMAANFATASPSAESFDFNLLST